MCIAICKPKDVIIPKSHLVESFKNNPDGAGFMYAENDILHIEKGFMTFDEFYSAYKPHEDKASAVHFRIATHGKTDKENTHPFQVGKNLGFIHNGIINRIDRKDDETKSDTYHFNTKILSQIYKRDSRFIFKEPFKELIQEYIGGSKLVFLNNKGHYTIVNEKMGKWEEGVWYSNTSYQARKVIAPYTPPQKKGEVFTVGSRVKVEYTHNKNNNGFGTVEYFTGGGMVGVKMDGQDKPRLIHMSFLFNPPTENVFEVGDWVIRNDGQMQDKVGEVQGIVGDSVIVRWLNGMGVFSAPDYVISQDKLEFWWDTTMEGYKQ